MYYSKSMINKMLEDMRAKNQQAAPVYDQPQSYAQYQQPLGYQLAQMPSLPKSQGTGYNADIARLIRGMQIQQMPQRQGVNGGGNYLFGQNLIQPTQTNNTSTFDYSNAIMGGRF